MRKYLLFICLSILFFSCKDSGNSNTGNIKEILVINRGGNKFLTDKTIITDSNAIAECGSLINTIVPFNGTPRVSANVGFFELIITFRDNKKRSIDIIYTIFDGIVIRGFNGDYFKQDKFVDYILRNVKEKQND